MRFLPTVKADEKAMLAVIGCSTVDELFAEIPSAIRLSRPLDLPPPLTESRLERHMAELIAKNRPVGGARPSFLGGGAYSHHVPAAVDALSSRGEFLTAYTPYQAEASQGTLQAIFEYQTMMSEITGLPLANASLYDGATAVMEACVLAHSVGRRGRFLISEGVSPECRQVLATFFQHTSFSLDVIPLGADGRSLFSGHAGEDVAALVIQSPNFFGCLEDVRSFADHAHHAGAHLIVSSDPLTLSVLEPPGKLGADIVVGEGQVFGNGVCFGGPHLGIFTCAQKFLRKMPGRLVGQTVDGHGKRAFALTLQTREQHIRREKATSNICTNQGLIALRTAIYLAGLGKGNFQKLGRLCLQSAHYLANRLEEQTRLRRRYPSAPFFREVCFDSPVPAREINARLDRAGICGGLPLDRYFPEDTSGWLLATTDSTEKNDIDRLVQVVAEVSGCSR